MLRKFVPFVLVAVVAFAVGWIAKNGRGGEKPAPAPANGVTVNYPEPASPSKRRTVRLVEIPPAQIRSTPDGVEWLVGADEWVIQDGNQRRQFRPAD